MSDWADPIVKVTALVTRRGVDGPELILFEHPSAGVQIPAGTVDVGEPPAAAALREGYEETGALGLRVVRELAVVTRSFIGRGGVLAVDLEVDGRVYYRGYHLRVFGIDGAGIADVELSDGTKASLPASDIARSEVRHLFHLRSTIEMPDEWLVATPDSGGAAWTCFWVPVHEAAGIELLHEWGRDWLDAARVERLDSERHGEVPRARAPLPSELEGPDSWETFWAPEWRERAHLDIAGMRYRLKIIAGFDDADACSRARVVCVTHDGRVVLVRDAVGWGFPGGGREPGETIDATVARELWEEANARPMETRLLGALRGVAIDDQGLVASPIDHHALLWARVELDEFTGAHETLERRIVSARDVDALLMLPYPGLLDLAARVDPLLDWDVDSR